MKLANQDKVTGQLKGIQDGKVTFASSYAELKIPMDRIQEMDFASAKADEPKAAAGECAGAAAGGGIDYDGCAELGGEELHGVEP